MPGVTRRSLLQAAPILAVLLTALPLVAFASAEAEPAETSILSLYRQWVDLEAEANSTTDITDEELDWAVGRINDLDECTAAEPVTCAADLAAKVLVLTGVTERGATRHEADLVTECEASVAGRVAQ